MTNERPAAAVCLVVKFPFSLALSVGCKTVPDHLEKQSCVKIFLISFENYPQNVPLPTPKMHYGATFQPAVPKTWQECFYATL